MPDRFKTIGKRIKAGAKGLAFFYVIMIPVLAAEYLLISILASQSDDLNHWVLRGAAIVVFAVVGAVIYHLGAKQRRMVLAQGKFYKPMGQMLIGLTGPVTLGNTLITMKIAPFWFEGFMMIIPPLAIATSYVFGLKPYDYEI